MTKNDSQSTLLTPGISLSSQVKTKDAMVLTTPMNTNLPKAPIHIPSVANCSTSISSRWKI